MTEGPFRSFCGVRVGGGFGSDVWPTMFGAFSGQVPRLVSQKLVKDPHNRRITEAEPKRNEMVLVK